MSEILLNLGLMIITHCIRWHIRDFNNKCKRKFRSECRKINAIYHNIKIKLIFDPEKHYDVDLLPLDMIKEITSYLCRTDLSSLRCVNKKINKNIGIKNGKGSSRSY